MKLRQILPYSLVLAALVTGVVWRLQDKRALADDLVKAQVARKSAAASVLLATAGPKRLAQTLEVVGTLESPRVVTLSSEVSGRIAFLAKREGDAVQAGETLLRIDPGELCAAVQQQEAALAEAKARLAQARATRETTRVGVASGIEQQSALVMSAQAELEQAQQSQAAQIATAKSGVADAAARVEASKVTIANAKNDEANARANLENLKARAARAKALLEKGFIAAQVVDDAQTALQVQQGLVDSAHGRVTAAQSALESAKAVLSAAENQVVVMEKKGIADIAVARARKQQAQSALTLARSNRSQTTAYQENLAALRQGAAAVEAQLAQAKARLADTELRSPSAGTITTRAFDEGSTVTAGQPILTIQSLGWLYVTASVPAEQSALVGRGTSATVLLDAYPEERFRATVAELNPRADPQSRQFTIRLKLDNASGKLKPGMYARVQIQTRAVDADVVVPTDAVKTTAKNTTITVVNPDNIAQIRDVKLGMKQGGEVQVLSGVTAGEKVITLSYTPIKEGQKVTEGSGEKGAKGKKKE